MRIFLFLLLVTGSTLVWGQPELKKYRVPNGVDAATLQEELRAQHFAVGFVEITKDGAWVVLDHSETKDPTQVIESLLPPNQKTMRVLVKKWKAGKITAAEKDQLLLLLIEMVLGI
ncbi:hypothetical protein ACFL2T_04475 [Elusimicrobiota bacterium]